MTPSRVRRITACALAGVLVGCSGGGADDAERRTPEATPSTSATASTPPEPPRPASGRCYALSYDDAVAPTATRPPVPCGRPHTAQTFHVGTLATVVDGHLLAVDSERARRQVAAECTTRFRRHVGGSTEQRRLSLLKPVWFSPTVEESDSGQAWFRCDVIAVAGAGRLAPLSGQLAGVLDRPAGRDRFGLCSPVGPGARGFRHVLCSDTDAWRAVLTLPLRPGRNGAWPGRTRPAAAETRCADAARRRAADVLNVVWGFEAPTREQWAAGQRYGFCWAPS
jgi:hypothetical protein